MVIRLMGAAYDLACAGLVIPLAFLIRTGDLPQLSPAFMVMQGSLVLGAGFCFYAFGLNQGSWRYASLDDLVGIIQSALLAMLLAVLATFAASRLETIPRLVPVIACVLLIVLMGGPRLAYRLFKDRYVQRRFKSARGGERIVIVGYSDEAHAFLRHLGRQRDPAYSVVGLIDHSHRHIGRKLNDVKVLGGIDQLAEIARGLAVIGAPIAKIVVARSKVDQETMATILDIGLELGIPVYTMPTAADLTASAEEKQAKPAPINIDDLLGRPDAEIDLQPIAAMLSRKTILITGGGGSIGSELVEQVMAYRPARLLILDNSEHNLYQIERRIRERYPDRDVTPIIADVRDRAVIRHVMASARPEIVFHAAALKHVPLVEHNPVEGVKTNVFGTVNVADMAVEFGAAAFVMISTDKAVNPTNVMGATKRAAEAYCQMIDRRPDCRTKFMTVRFGNVLGSAGSVVPLFAHQIAQGGPVTVTHPQMRRYFMSMREAVKLVLAASAKGLAQPEERGKIMVLNMGTQVRIVDLANRMIQLAGLKPGVDVSIHYTGLRPGEKLYEERLEATEEVEDTADAWLQIANPRPVDPQALTIALRRLLDAAGGRDEAGLMSALRSIVPELAPAQPSWTAPVEDRGRVTPIPLFDVVERRRK